MPKITIDLSTADAARAGTALRAQVPWNEVDADGDPTPDTRTLSEVAAAFALEAISQTALAYEAREAARARVPLRAR